MNKNGLPRTFRLGHLTAFLGHDGEVEFTTSLSGAPEERVRGKGRKPDLATLRLMWGIVLGSARLHGLERLYCEPTLDDGRGRTRIAAYRRAGFKVVHQDKGLVWMEYSLK